MSKVPLAARTSSPAAILLCLVTAMPLFAHDPGLSTLNVQFRPHALDILLVMSMKDADLLVTQDQIYAGREVPRQSKSVVAALAAKAGEVLKVTIDDLPATIVSTEVSFDRDNATLRLRVPRRPVAKLEIRSSWLALLPAGHRQFLTIRDAKAGVLAERLLSAQTDTATLQLAGAGYAEGERPAGTSFLDFLRLGFNHILSGYDHLLFITALVLATATLWDLLKVVTAFTLAHTVTLTLAALSLLRLPASLVEPLIAGSIVLVALTNVFWPNRSRGWPRLATAFFFGLFHGLGFAGGLLGATEGTAGLAILVAIAAFSLGVELGHQSIVLPLFLGSTLARATRADDQSRQRLSLTTMRAGSALISLAGGACFIAALR